MNLRAAISDIHQDAANKHIIVSNFHRDTSDVGVIAPDVRRDASNTHTVVSDIHGNKLKGHKGMDGRNQAVSTTCTLPATE